MKSIRLALCVVICFLAVMIFRNSIVCAEPPHKAIMEKLDTIQDTLDLYLTGGVPRTGQTICYDVDGDIVACADTGQDGEYQKGKPWPTPRFTDNGDGTITDNLTKLVWLKHANCYGWKTWAEALTLCNNMADPDCGLTDGSVPGDWRLPTVKELQSLLHYGVYRPALPNTAGTGQWSEGDPFTNVKTECWYWSSDTYAKEANTNHAWWVGVHYGGVGVAPKDQTDYFRVWPVRDPF